MNIPDYYQGAQKHKDFPSVISSCCGWTQKNKSCRHSS